MKKEYIELFEGIEPDEKIKNKALDKASNNSKIPFSPKKFIAFAAVFALILSLGFGVYRSSSVNAVNDDGTSQQTAQSSLDFSIVAYAKENENGVLYVNGVKTETTNLGIIENLVNTPPNTPIQIGSDIYETYNPEGDTENRKYPLNGEIYASRVYNRPLTEQEVLYNYNTTLNNK